MATENLVFRQGYRQAYEGFMNDRHEKATACGGRAKQALLERGAVTPLLVGWAVHGTCGRPIY